MQKKKERNQEGGKYYSLVIWINPKNNNNNFQNTDTKFHSFYTVSVKPTHQRKVYVFEDTDTQK